MIPAIVARFTGRGHKNGRAERRRAKRVAPPQLSPCHLTTTEGEPLENALIRDLSRQGAGIVSERNFAPGSMLNVLLVNANHTFALSVEYEVVRCARSPVGKYLLGGRFSRPLRHDEVTPFLR